MRGEEGDRREVRSDCCWWESNLPPIERWGGGDEEEEMGKSGG